MEPDPETFEQIGQEDDVEEIIGDGNDDDSTQVLKVKVSFCSYEQ